MDMETLREIMSRPVCLPCLRAVEASVKRTGEDFVEAEQFYMLARDFGNRVSSHECEEEEDDDVDCWCHCRFGDGMFGKSFNEVTTKGTVCDLCIEAVQEALEVAHEAFSVDDDSPADIMYVYAVARVSGGEFEHECEVEEDSSVECHCSCAAVPNVYCDSCHDAVAPSDIVVRSLCQECAEEKSPHRRIF